MWSPLPIVKQHCLAMVNFRLLWSFVTFNQLFETILLAFVHILMWMFLIAPILIIIYKVANTLME
jgi:hypothetical protein